MTWEWTWYTWAWLIWFVAGVVLEIVAMIDPRKGDTLSAHVKFLMLRKFFRLTIILFLTWLTIHWATGGWI